MGIALGAGVGAAFYLISALGAVLLFSGIGIARARRDESDEKEIHDTEKAELKALTERTEELRSMLESFTRKLGEPGENLSCELTKIKAEYTRYYTVSTARRSEDIGREKRLETARIMRKRAEEFISRYPLDAPDPLLRLSELLTEYSFTRIETEKAREECKKYKERYDVKEAADETPICDDGDLSGEISRREAELSEISVELARLKSACEKDLTERERAWELEGEITALEEKLTEYTETLSVIQSTMSLLAEACDNMTSRYIGKTKESFLRYEEALGGNGGSFAVDTDFALSKSEHGAARSEESYSRGTRDLYSLAMRLGLVDSLYESEQPFIILDDPFISLDDERLKKGKKLLAELAKKRQILYFTCANSRKI